MFQEKGKYAFTLIVQFAQLQTNRDKGGTNTEALPHSKQKCTQVP